MNSSFPLTPLLKLSPNSITQWVRGFSHELETHLEFENFYLFKKF